MYEKYQKSLDQDEDFGSGDEFSNRKIKKLISTRESRETVLIIIEWKLIEEMVLSSRHNIYSVIKLILKMLFVISGLSGCFYLNHP